MMDAELVKILCCPESRQGLRLADPALVEQLNQQVAAGRLKNRVGKLVVERIDGALVRADGKFAYPVRNHIPVILVDEAIPLATR